MVSSGVEDTLRFLSKNDDFRQKCGRLAIKMTIWAVTPELPRITKAFGIDENRAKTVKKWRFYTKPFGVEKKPQIHENAG